MSDETKLVELLYYILCVVLYKSNWAVIPNFEFPCEKIINKDLIFSNSIFDIFSLVISIYLLMI